MRKPPPSARHHRICSPRTSHGFTLPEMLVVIGAVLIATVLVLVIQHSLRPSRPRRSACAVNLKALGTALWTYSNENHDMFPIVPHAPADQDGIGNVTYAPGKIGVKRGGITGQGSRPGDDPVAGGSTTTDIELSTTRNLWILVRARMISTRSLFCPSAPGDLPNNEDSPDDYFDAKAYTEVSYGYQVPYGRRGQPSLEMDFGMVIAADKGPYGAALEAGAPDPGVPMPSAATDPDDWMPWNSRNHLGLGQLMLFADTHANYMTRPLGFRNDNIYTRWTGPEADDLTNESARMYGVPPTGRETPWSDTDSLIYP